MVNGKTVNEEEHGMDLLDRASVRLQEVLGYARAQTVLLLRLVSEYIERKKNPHLPPRPPIKNREHFVEWMLRYDLQMEFIRNIVKTDDRDHLISTLSKAILDDLYMHRTRSELIERLEGLEEYYTKMQQLINRNGGIRRCVKDMQATYVFVKARLTILPYFMSYLYQDSSYIQKMGLKEL